MSVLCVLSFGLCASRLRGETNAVLDTTDRHYLEQALRALKMSPHDLSFSKTNVASDLVLPLARTFLQQPLTLPAFAEQRLTEFRAITNLVALGVCLETPFRAFVVPTSVGGQRKRPRIPTKVGTTSNTLTGPPASAPSLDHAIILIYSAAERVQPLLPRPNQAAWDAFALETFHDDADKAGLDPELVRRDKALELQDDELANRLLTANDKFDRANLMRAFATLLAAVDQAVAELRQVPAGAVPDSVTDTPLGKIIIGGASKNVYKDEAFLIIDLGGNDTYENLTGGANGLHNRPISIVVDLTGNDQYVSHRSHSQGAGVFGIGILVDGGGHDVYEAKHLSQGAGFFGCGMLVDYGGHDKFVADTFAQGAGEFGVGILWQGAGRLEGEPSGLGQHAARQEPRPPVNNDTIYTAASMSQGYGGTGGVGLLLDSAGKDEYIAAGSEPCSWLPGHKFTLSQGFGFGMRPFAGGGIGILCDLKGDDRYVADVYGQGASYWYSVGLLLDAEGDDRYEAYQYCQGAGIHLSSGALVDWAGNDTYTAGHICQGGAHDYAVGMLIDRVGNDRYEGETTAQGAAINNSLGLLLDRAGDDSYVGKDPQQSQAAGHDGGKREYGSIALLLDLAGKDAYSQGQANNTTWVKPWYGAGIDCEAVWSAPTRRRFSPSLLPPEQQSGDKSPHSKYRTVDVHHPIEHLIRVAISDHDGAEEAWQELKHLGTQALPYWLTRVDSPNVMYRAKAEELIDYLGTNSVPALIDGIKNAPTEDAARLCCYYLARFDTATNAIPVVLPLLRRQETQSTALYTLGHLRAQQAFPAANRFLRDGRETVRLRAAQALGRIGDQRAIPRLKAALRDEFWDVRFAAAEALGQLGVEKFKVPAGQPPPLPGPAR